jgi:hypothetical protein
MYFLKLVIFVIYLIYHVEAGSLSATDDGENIFNDAQNGFIPGTRELFKLKMNIVIQSYYLDRITCHCNICYNAFHCATNGYCYISSKFDKTGETKIFTQG